MAISLPKGKKAWMVFGVGGAVVVGVLWYRHRSQASAAAATAGGTDTTGTTDSGQIDPLTGDIAGSAQDQYDLANLQDSGYGAYGSGNGYGGGYGFPPNSGGGGNIPGSGGFTTNGEWMQQAESDLGGIGINETTLSAALGKYLTGAAVTSDQASLIDQAIAAEGYPPVSGPHGFPPSIKDQGSGGGGGGGGGTVKVPQVTGDRADVARQTLRKAGLAYNISDKATGSVTGQSPKAGTSVSRGSSVHLTIKQGK